MPKLTAAFRIASPSPLWSGFRPTWELASELIDPTQTFFYRVQLETFDVELTLFLYPHEHGYVTNEIEVRVSREEPNDALDFHHYNATHLEYMNVALEVANRAVSYFKYDLRNPLLRPLRGIDVYDYAWFDTNGKRLQARHVRFLPEPKITTRFGVIMFDDKKDTELNARLNEPVQAPTLAEEILSDAQAAAYEGNIRRATVELAVACEVAVRRTFLSRDTTYAEALFDCLEDKSRIRILELIDKDVQDAIGQSFKKAYPKDYENIEDLLTARNKAAHRGQETIGAEVLDEWWNSALTLMTWLRGLNLSES